MNRFLHRSGFGIDIAHVFRTGTAGLLHPRRSHLLW